MSTIRLAIALALTFSFSSLSTFTASSAQAAWVDRHCNNTGPLTYNGISRSGARSYAVTANGDGYEWGGGCWNSNGVDDTPGAPDSGGEGPDCSGFTFKSWHLPLNMNAGSGVVRFWNWKTDVHGPYRAADFKAGVGVPRQKSKTYANTLNMDAFASSSHIGMIYAEDAGGYDRIIEAKGDSAGTGIWRRSYRSSTAYGAVGRTGWS